MCTNARESDFLRYGGEVNGGGRFEVSSSKGLKLGGPCTFLRTQSR